MRTRTEAPAMDRITLRFGDPTLERTFLDDFFEHVRTPIRIAYGLGVVMWVLWGLVVRRFLVDERAFDIAVRYLFMIPLLLVAAALTLLPSWRRWWQVEEIGVVLLTGAAWIVYTDEQQEMPFDFGYVGLILIMTFGYSLVRMRFLPVLFSSTALIVVYVGFALAGDADPDRLALAAYYLGSFLVLGTVASYTLERSTRLLCLRERELDRERDRSDALLLNILPRAIVDRLKARGEEATTARVADGLAEVTVFFVDMEGFTEQAARTTPDVLVDSLDDLFSRFDMI
ncbi:MAG: adenylate/guanylate cyclase domain-containing protein, partial [Actinomycetota bacterium]